MARNIYYGNSNKKRGERTDNANTGQNKLQAINCCYRPRKIFYND